MFNGAKHIILILALVAMFAGACSSANLAAPTFPDTKPATAPATSPPIPAQESNLPDRVDVVYFQSGNPCACMAAIGENIHTVVLKDFQNEMATGKLTFKMLASDDNANSAMVKKYNAPPFGLFLTIVKGETERIVPVAEIWGMTGDEAKYMGYVKDVIAKSLKGEI